MVDMTFLRLGGKITGNAAGIVESITIADETVHPRDDETMDDIAERKSVGATIILGIIGEEGTFDKEPKRLFC